jgi:hypothetical protein
MASIPLTARSTTVTEFPTAQVEAELRRAITRLSEDTEGMREPWEPRFDSLAIVGIVIVVEKLIPGFKIEPDKVVRRGGYSTIDDAASDITNRVRRRWERHQTKE